MGKFVVNSSLKTAQGGEGHAGCGGKQHERGLLGGFASGGLWGLYFRRRGLHGRQYSLEGGLTVGAMVGVWVHSKAGSVDTSWLSTVICGKHF